MIVADVPPKLISGIGIPVDGIVLVVDAGHPADDGVGKGADAVA